MIDNNNVILDVRSISRHFGALKAVDRVSFQVRKGEIIGLIGPNGAGKTTITNLVTGDLKRMRAKSIIREPMLVVCSHFRLPVLV